MAEAAEAGTCYYCYQTVDASGRQGAAISYICEHSVHLRCAMPNHAAPPLACPKCVAGQATARASIATDQSSRDQLAANAATTFAGYLSSMQCSKAIGATPGVRELLLSSPVSVADLASLSDSGRVTLGASPRLEALKRASIMRIAQLEKDAAQRPTDPSRHNPTVLGRRALEVISRGDVVKDPALYFDTVYYSLTADSTCQTGVVRIDQLARKTAEKAAEIDRSYVLLSLATMHEATPAQVSTDALLTFSGIAEVVKRDARLIFSAPAVHEASRLSLNQTRIRSDERAARMTLGDSLASDAWTITTVIEAGLVTSWDELSPLTNLLPYLRTHGLALARLPVTYRHIQEAFTSVSSWQEFAALRFTAADLCALGLTPDDVIASVTASNRVFEFAVFRYLKASGLDAWGFNISHLRKLVVVKGAAINRNTEDRVNEAIRSYATSPDGLAIPLDEANIYFLSTE